MKRFLRRAKAVILAAVVASSSITGSFTGELSEVNAQQQVEKIYVSNTGTAAGDGSKENPYDLETAINLSKDGMEIHLAPGIYEFSAKIRIRNYLSGTEDKRRSLIADGEVIFDFSGQTDNEKGCGMLLEAWNWDVKGIRIRRAYSQGMILGGSYNLVENCVFESNGKPGLHICRSGENVWPKYNLIKNCTSFNNYDAERGGEDADGFAASITCGEGNVFDGCIAYNNSDDGWDLFAKPETGSIGKVTLRNCVAFRNGYLLNGETTENGDGNGFKLGGSKLPTDHEVINCLAFENIQSGFTDNSNPGALKLRNCTSINNSLVYNSKNYAFNRENNGIKKNILSHVNQDIPGIYTDGFCSTMDHSICWIKGGKYQYVQDEKFVSENAVDGTDVSVTDEDFYSILAPASTEDIHSLFRDEDGTINLHGLYEIKKDSQLATMADDGGCVGARLSNEQGFTQQESPDLRQEQYIIPAGKLEFEGDLSPELSGGIYNEPFTYNEFTITATKEKDMRVDFATVSYEPEELNFYKRIYFYGRGQADYRSIIYEAKEAGTISIYGNGLSLDSPRTIQLCKENGTVLETKPLPGDKIYKIDFDIPAAGNYYITSYSSGWYMYYARFEKKESESGGTQEDDSKEDDSKKDDTKEDGTKEDDSKEDDTKEDESKEDISDVTKGPWSGVSKTDDQNTSWTLDADGTLTLEGSKFVTTMLIHNEIILNNDDIKAADIKKVVVKEGIKGIGASAFKRLPELKEVILPSTVKDIYPSAFEGCEKLIKINIPEGVNELSQTFVECSALETIELPKSITSLSGTFKDCPKLKGVVIPTGTTIIGEETFRNCTSITDITIPATVTTLDNNVFSGCTSLSKIELNGKYDEIGASCFSNCKSLKHVIIPASVTNIGSQAFSYCESLESVTVKGAYTVIGSYALYSCENLKTIQIEASQYAKFNDGSLSGTQVESIIFTQKNPRLDVSWSGVLGGINEKLTIYGLSGSTAQKSAQLENIPFKVIDKNTPKPGETQGESNPVDNTPCVTENSTENITSADISLPYSEMTLGITAAKKNVVGNNVFTMIPFVKSTDINDKVVWTVYEEGESCEPGKSGKNAKKYLTVANGKLTAKKAGVGKTVILKAQIKNGKSYKESATCTVKIIDDAAYTLPQNALLTSDITVSENTFNVNINGKGMKAAKPMAGEVLTNKGILLPACGAIAGNSNKIKWSIDDKEEKKLASVNSAGKITARKPGTVNVTAKLGEQIIIYKVNIHTAYVELNTESDSYNAKSKNFVAPISEGINVSDCIKSVSGVDTDRNHIVYSIPSVAHQKIATIDANTGVLTPTGLKGGKITVNATINGVSAPIKIDVKL